MMTQKGDPYIFYTSILSQLNILCSSLLIQYHSKNNDLTIIHHSHVTATSCVPQHTGFHWSRV